MRNLNLLFHKLYYNKIGNTGSTADNETKKIFANDVKARNEEIFASRFVHEDDFLKCEIDGVVSFPMKTKYPGLLIGIGYPHGSGRADDDIKCGFSFDYVSGQPYIPGSSVKGVLRSHFKMHPTEIAEILKQLNPNAEISQETVKDLEADIFDYGDTFLDAVLYDGDEQYRILGKEYITPHAESTQNPNPIHIMKILPNVRFEFRFIVSDFEKDDFTFTKDQKRALFQTLLELFGVGAKTNVGYGMLEFDHSAPRPRPTQQNTQQGNGFNNQGSNNYAGNSRSNNYGGGQRNNNYGGTSSPQKVKCPSCGYMNFKYRLDGTRNTKCKQCKTNLP